MSEEEPVFHPKNYFGAIKIQSGLLNGENIHENAKFIIFERLELSKCSFLPKVQQLDNKSAGMHKKVEVEIWMVLFDV